jgi:hypothetical protein
MSIAGLYTLVVTCEARGLNPFAYLADAIPRVQDHPSAGSTSPALSALAQIGRFPAHDGLQAGLQRGRRNRVDPNVPRY